MLFETRLTDMFGGNRQATVGGSAPGRRRRASAVLATVGITLAASLYAIAGPVMTASAITAPGMLSYPLTVDTQIRQSDGEKPLISVDLTLKSGESRRLIGVLNATMNTTTQTDMDDTATLRCVYPSSGLTAGIAATAEQGLEPLETKELRPTVLFTAPLDGTYHCYLAAQTGSTTGPYMTVHKDRTLLEVSAGNEVGAHMWQNPPCDTAGQFATCTYLGEPGGPTQRFVLDNDGSVNKDGSSPLSPWTAASNATAINVTANVELTECGHTASCGGRTHDGDSGTVSSYFQVTQLNALGNTCNSTQTDAQTDVIDKYQHHYNIAYSLPNVPVLTSCGSTNFRVRVIVQWVSGNSIKIDGSRTDPLAYTNAVAVNSSYSSPVSVFAGTPFGTADFDGDGHSDVIARNDATGDLWLYPGPGTRNALTATPVLIGSGWNGFTPFGVADYNGDGHMDIIARQDFAYNGTPAGSLWMYPGAGGRGPLNQNARVQIGDGWVGFTPFGVADWDGDGHPDIVARQDFDFGGTPAGSLFKYPGNGAYLNEGARVQIDVGWTTYTSFGIGDYNGDGHPDIVARNDLFGNLVLMPGNGGHLTTQTTIGTGWGGWSPIGLTDYDRDGHVDIIARQDFTDAGTTAGTVVVFTGGGNRMSISTGWPVGVPSPSPVITPVANQTSLLGGAAALGMTVSSGVAPYTWTATGLPAGLGINATTGQIGGTPTAAGSYAVTVTVTDAANPAHTGTVSYTWTITAAVPDVLGGSQSAATAAIHAAGLTLGSITHTNTCTDAGLVDSQNPVGGMTVTQGSAVNIDIATCTGGGGK